MFSADAARIYISQLTKIDQNFGIAQGVPGNTRPGAAVGIKADDVRIVARNSFKICTGRGSGFEGHGTRGENKCIWRPRVRLLPLSKLIAGNYSDSKWVLRRFEEPYRDGALFTSRRQRRKSHQGANWNEWKLWENIWSAVYNLVLIQAGYNVTNSIDPWRSWNAAQGPPATGGIMSYALMNLWATRVKGTMWEQYYLVESGYRYINSPNVFLT